MFLSIKALIIPFVTLAPIGGTLAITSSLLIPPQSLNLERLKWFIAANKFDECQTFLSNENKYALLFACWSENKARDNNEINRTEYYFYNGRSWNKALELSSGSGDLIFVTTKNSWWAEKIKDNASNSLKNMNRVNLTEWCQVQPTTIYSEAKSVNCHQSGMSGYDDETTKLPLKEFN